MRLCLFVCVLTGMFFVCQDDFLNEVCSAAHKINSPMMSRRPIYGPTGEKDKNGKEKWAIVGYDDIETVPVSKQEEIISKKISHFSADGFWTASESDDEEAFTKLMSWADTVGLKTAFIDVISSTFRTGDGAVYLYQTDDPDDPIQYEVYGYEEGSVLFPHVDFDGRKTLARKYKFNTHDAVDIFTPEKIETWMLLDEQMEDYRMFVPEGISPAIKVRIMLISTSAAPPSGGSEELSDMILSNQY